MKKYAMIYDENLCIGCQGCLVACKNENKVPDGVSRLEVHSNMKGSFPNLKIDFQRHSCVMCDESPCVDVCPTHASFKLDNGITMIDERTCIGCKYCILACPYDARYVDPITHAVSKCTFCFDTRVGRGDEPACVSVCPTDALIFGDLNDENSFIRKVASQNSLSFPKQELGTKPKLAFIKNKKGGYYE
ncbi:4Fe-4S dicluster domain-containing protein [Campylobacter sp. FMV-PI01]|uniref:4Fe-4S dicluster domain-containing protein n=1 Tax=Campylobacter portucalensis TaxID=2608384 RepID=A0A6L5WFU9_9BACT|nr:4Fe-4S dicluster domain-containing protein [Campylobacter portucalensis]MSN95769.1 4Fe-4S dicluster domain-containing protein [Campylobacter portucalensis]